MKSFNLDRHGVNHGGTVAQNIVVMKKQMCGGKVEPIRAAPSRFALKMFGGHMTIEEFRSHGEPGGCVMSMPDEMFRVQIAMKPKYQDGATHHLTSAPPAYSDRKMSDIHSTVAKNETLKLKRPKPLKREENNLEKSLGIIRSVPLKSA
jgi:hypothetical protein